MENAYQSALRDTILLKVKIHVLINAYLAIIHVALALILILVLAVLIQLIY